MAAGPLDLRALNHASFVVRDVEESTNFYKCALVAAISYAHLRKCPGYGSDTQAHGLDTQLPPRSCRHVLGFHLVKRPENFKFDGSW